MTFSVTLKSGLLLLTSYPFNPPLTMLPMVTMHDPDRNMPRTQEILLREAAVVAMVVFLVAGIEIPKGNNTLFSGFVLRS